MRKKAAALLAVLMMALALAGCHDDNDYYGPGDFNDPGQDGVQYAETQPEDGMFVLSGQGAYGAVGQAAASARGDVDDASGGGGITVSSGQSVSGDAVTGLPDASAGGTAPDAGATDPYLPESRNWHEIAGMPDGSQADSLEALGIPEWSGEPYLVLNGNEPFFGSPSNAMPYESYSSLDDYGRCGPACACLGTETMPADGERRGDISKIEPSGWVNAVYSDVVDGGYLYNRCHLIGWQLSAENANRKNLVTGTRYLNVNGMLPFENLVADYILDTGNHVQYRVTPVYLKDALVCSGVVMEAMDVEDGGSEVMFNVFCYNVQPGIEILYATGESRLADSGSDDRYNEAENHTYVLNLATGKFHEPGCASVMSMLYKNRQDYRGPREDLISEGWEPCKACDP